MSTGPRLLVTIAGVAVRQDDDLRVYFKAKAAIDADGANGQNGGKAAYMVGDKGSDYLANGGMKIDQDGEVVFSAAWGKDVVIQEQGKPKIFPGGIIASKTAYKWPSKDSRDPEAYVDSETVPYVVVPPKVRQLAKGIVLGCKAMVTYKGKTVDAVVADIGPGSKIGELSIAAARAVGIPTSPKTGGLETNSVLYELFPGTAAVVNGVTYVLLKA